MTVEQGRSGEEYGLGVDGLGRPEKAEVVEEGGEQGAARAPQPAQLPRPGATGRPLGPGQHQQGGQLRHQDDVIVEACGSHVIHFEALRTLC